MVPKFERRVRAFAIDTSGVFITVILSLFIPKPFNFILIGAAVLGFYIMPYFISNGQTFGKRVEKIKVVNLDGSDASVAKLLIREITKLALSVLTFGIYLVVAFFAVTEKEVSRTIHDYIFKTKMIDLDTTKKHKTDPVLGKGEYAKKRGL